MKKRLFIITTLAIMLSCILTGFSVSAEEAIPAEFQKSAMEFVNDIDIGWNLGNSLDAFDNNNQYGPNVTPSQIEQHWYNPVTTKPMLAKVKEAGFNAVRIPVTWSTFTGAGPDYQIRQDWMDRVQEVVDYAIELDLYVILNVHHDDDLESGWLLPVTENKEETMQRFEKIWTQIANRFKSYSSKLIFEGMNELFLPDTDSETSFSGTAESRQIINELNQTFVDTVRATGGNNRYRYLSCPTHGAAAVNAAFSGFELPDDDHLILSVHIYDQNLQYFKEKLIKLKADYIDQGIPVIIGEWGTNNTLAVDTRAEHAEKYMNFASLYGMKTFVWDDGGKATLLNRRTLEWRFPEIKDAMIKGAQGSDTVLAWTAALDANWAGKPTATYHSDGSVDFVWSGKAGIGGGRQNQYASKFSYGGDFANSAIAKAKKEGKTIEFTIKYLKGFDQNGNALNKVQFFGVAPFEVGGCWLQAGEETTITMDVSEFEGMVNGNSTIQLVVQNYDWSIQSMHDIELWVSPIVVSE